MPNTVRFHRVLRANPEKVYKAFIDPDAMAKWLPPNGFTGRVHEMDARARSAPDMSSSGPENGSPIRTGSTTPAYPGRCG